jgi:hypothetical protein
MTRLLELQIYSNGKQVFKFFSKFLFSEFVAFGYVRKRDKGTTPKFSSIL